jgi:ubiquinone/menaquinone biosynthesis C-methylase UbiE
MKNKNAVDNPTYYEHFNWEMSNLGIHLRNKIEKIFEFIPNDVKTIIDIGCSDGTITNELAKKYKVTGVDRSANALKFVTTTKILSSSGKIDVPDNSFDMVFSSELLEHLEDKVFGETIKEMKRISRKYIFITVPNGEVVEKDFIQCPNCGCIFNRAYHLRSFKLENTKDFFSDYNVIKSIEFGSGKRGYNKLLLNIKHKLVPSSSWIPKYWTRNSLRKSMCPKCETDFTYRYKFNLLGFFCDTLNIIFSPHKPYWLFVLLKTSNARKT